VENYMYCIRKFHVHCSIMGKKLDREIWQNVN
jgi:hypothetical protein